MSENFELCSFCNQMIERQIYSLHLTNSCHKLKKLIYFFDKYTNLLQMAKHIDFEIRNLTNTFNNESYFFWVQLIRCTISNLSDFCKMDSEYLFKNFKKFFDEINSKEKLEFFQQHFSKNNKIYNFNQVYYNFTITQALFGNKLYNYSNFIEIKKIDYKILDNYLDPNVKIFTIGYNQEGWIFPYLEAGIKKYNLLISLTNQVNKINEINQRKKDFKANLKFELEEIAMHPDRYSKWYLDFEEQKKFLK